jgi:hypothetical protein
MKKIGSSSLKMLCACAFLLLTTNIQAQRNASHPHILVRAGDKAAVLRKMEQQPWAGKIFKEMRSGVDKYVERHQGDPDWILSRYLMNRVPGKRYTRFFSDPEGTALMGYGGDAPVPTVRVSPHKRGPVGPDGKGYRMPRLEDQIPNDTSMRMRLQRSGSKDEWDLVDPMAMVQSFNGRINEMALHAAIIYWLTGSESHAKFAADILDQWARGAYHQQPVEGPCRTGFLSIQSIGDGAYEPMPIIYDFLYDYLRKHRYETKWYEPVFQKIAHTMTFRGFWDNNWFAAQTPLMVFATLSLEDRAEREKYIDYFLRRDTIAGACGHLSMPTLIEHHFTPDGHWKEPGGYHNFPVSSLLISALAMEQNGYPVFRDHPALFAASHALLKYSFPNLKALSIGDTGPASQSGECLEIGLLFAQRYDISMYRQLVTSHEALTKLNGYDRSKADYLGLLCYLPEIKEAAAKAYEWPRSGVLDFARCYLQRNGMDRQHGLMYAVQGATYNHNHANGMAVELYGRGRVMGPDPGKGINYEAPMHVNYYAQWAAHNTVIAGGRSTSVPAFRGGGGTKHIGQVELASMEPMADQSAVSPYASFTDTRYTDLSTKARQQRTLAIVRTSPMTGYYVDVYRSDHPESNEYVYHNVGDGVKWLDTERRPLTAEPASIPLHSSPLDPPGMRMFQQTSRLAPGVSNPVARFDVGGDRMQMLTLSAPGRTYFGGEAPPTLTADAAYHDKPTPVVVLRQNGEAWKRPFVAVFEPYAQDEGHSVDAITSISSEDPGVFTALEVQNNKRVGGSRQLIFQSVDPQIARSGKDWTFTGAFGVVSLLGDSCQYLYLGAGRSIGYGDISLRMEGASGSAHLEQRDGALLLSADQPVVLTLKNRTLSTIRAEGASAQLKVQVDVSAVEISIPAVRGLVLRIE